MRLPAGISPLYDKFFGAAPARRDMAYQYLAQGSGGVLAAWIGGGMKEPREKVAALPLKM